MDFLHHELEPPRNPHDGYRDPHTGEWVPPKFETLQPREEDFGFFGNKAMGLFGKLCKGVGSVNSARKDMQHGFEDAVFRKP